MNKNNDKVNKFIAVRETMLEKEKIFEKRMAELVAKLKESEVKLNKKNKSLKKLRKEVSQREDSFEKEMESINVRLNELNTENLSLRSEIKQNNEGSLTEVKVLKEQKQQSDEKRRYLNKTVKQLKQQKVLDAENLEKYEKKIAGLAEKNQQLLKEAISNKNSSSKLKKRLKEVKDELATVQDEFKKSKANVNEVEEKYITQAEVNKTLKAKISGQSLKLAEALQNSNNLQKKLAEFNKTTSMWEEKANDALQNIKIEQFKSADLEQINANNTKLISELRNEIHCLQEANIQNKEALSNLKAKEAIFNSGLTVSAEVHQRLKTRLQSIEQVLNERGINVAFILKQSLYIENKTLEDKRTDNVVSFLPKIEVGEAKATKEVKSNTTEQKDISTKATDSITSDTNDQDKENQKRQEKHIAKPPTRVLRQIKKSKKLTNLDDRPKKLVQRSKPVLHKTKKAMPLKLQFSKLESGVRPEEIVTSPKTGIEKLLYGKV